MAPHSSILAWRIPWTEEPGGLQSMGSQRVAHDLVTKETTKNNHFSVKGQVLDKAAHKLQEQTPRGKGREPGVRRVLLGMTHATGESLGN